MRQRKIRNEEEKLAALAGHMTREPMSIRGSWRQYFGNDEPIYIEIGCGKGQFALTMAALHPENNYIAVEGQGSVILRALEKAKKSGLSNIVFMNEFIRDIEEYFDESELSGVYLNFSDPWPKDRHAKRRLTHADYLDGYKRILKPESAIEFKTDNDGLFAFTLEEFIACGLEIIESTSDLHGSALPARLATTEYEDKFVKQGKHINYCKAKVL